MSRFGVFFAAFLLAGLAWTADRAEAFHDGSVGSCNGCHIQHATPGGPTRWLLKASDASSVCLACHAGPGGGAEISVYSFDGSALTPAGDFYWLTKSFSWTGGASPAESHGHNVIALDFGLTRDPVRLQAPGGTYPSANLSCVSCHDPHGKVRGGTRSGQGPVSVSGSYGALPGVSAVAGNYRLLGDASYTGGVSGYSFLNASPVARQSSLIRYGEADSSHVDYGAGMSEWCANCHRDILADGHRLTEPEFRHPSGNAAKLPDRHLTQYQRYLATGNLAGLAATSYLQFVPFERGTANVQELDPASTQGPNASANVSCLSCHRAHGSAFRAAGRWDFDATLLVDSHPGEGDAGVSGNDVTNSYYRRSIGTEFGSGQKSFCEKCHDALP